jgi:hypothetical protein
LRNPPSAFGFSKSLGEGIYHLFAAHWIVTRNGHLGLCFRYWWRYVAEEKPKSIALNEQLVDRPLASGIGRASSLALAKEGARGLLVADLNLEGAEKTAADARSVATNSEFQVEAIQIDVAIEDSVDRAIAHMVEKFGRIDYCVHSAGVSIALRLLGNAFDSKFGPRLDFRTCPVYVAADLSCV